MTHRSKHMPYYCIIFGLLSMSVGYNIILWNKVQDLNSKNTQSWVSLEDMKIIESEIKRLEKQSYKIPKQ